MTGPSAIREQRERREIIRTGNQPASSFIQEAVKGRSLEGGNYTAQRDLVITGEEIVARYPVDEMQPVGTAVEIAQSIEALAAASSPTAGDLATSHSAPNPAVERREVAISPEDEATLKALLGRGLKRRRI